MSTINRQQQRLFASVAEKLPPHENMASWLCDLLDIDQSNAYRRIRGEKDLSFTEYYKICTHLPVTAALFTASLPQQSLIYGDISTFKCWSSLKDYLQRLVGIFKKVLVQSDHHLYYLGRDLPVFFFYSSPVLMRYKFDVWLRSSGSKQTLTIPEDILLLGKELFDCYSALNTTELWYNWSFVNQIGQMKYWYEMDYMDQDEVYEICDNLEYQVSEIQKQLETGRKYKQGEFNLSILEFCTMNNGGLLEMNGQKILMNAFQSINFITTTSLAAIDLFESHWRQHLSFGQSISGGNSKLRHYYTKRFRLAVNEFRESL